MKHFKRVVFTIVAVIAAAIPAILADPSFGHYVAEHPWAVAYLPIATGIVRAIAKAIQDVKGSTNAGATGTK